MRHSEATANYACPRGVSRATVVMLSNLYIVRDQGSIPNQLIHSKRSGVNPKPRFWPNRISLLAKCFICIYSRCQKYNLILQEYVLFVYPTKATRTAHPGGVPTVSSGVSGVGGGGYRCGGGGVQSRRAIHGNIQRPTSSTGAPVPCRLPAGAPGVNRHRSRCLPGLPLGQPYPDGHRCQQLSTALCRSPSVAPPRGEASHRNPTGSVDARIS